MIWAVILLAGLLVFLQGRIMQLQVENEQLVKESDRHLAAARGWQRKYEQLHTAVRGSLAEPADAEQVERSEKQP